MGIQLALQRPHSRAGAPQTGRHYQDWPGLRSDNAICLQAMGSLERNDSACRSWAIDAIDNEGNATSLQHHLHRVHHFSRTALADQRPGTRKRSRRRRGNGYESIKAHQQTQRQNKKQACMREEKHFSAIHAKDSFTSLFRNLSLLSSIPHTCGDEDGLNDQALALLRE
jgi:hypothetical protein